MGKKRERALQARIDELEASIARRNEAQGVARYDREQNLAAAQREMVEDWFAIITKSGRVIRGKAKSVVTSSAPVDVTSSSGSTWRMFSPGLRERTAQIIIEPIK